MNRSVLIIAFTLLLYGCKDKSESSQPQSDSTAVVAVEVAQPTVSVELTDRDWPQWRGPNSTGVAPTTAQPPVQWSETAGVLWTVPINGLSHASPIVVGDRVIVTAADTTQSTQSVLCFDRNGKQLWSTTVHKGPFVRLQRKNSHASATPACDGKRIYTVFTNDAALWASALDLDGNILWQERVGNYESEHGYGSSPVLYKGLVILSGEHLGEGGGFIAAVRQDNGQVAWIQPRKMSGRNASYASPYVAHVAGRDQLLLHGYDHVAGFDPATGKELWRCQGTSDVCANTMTSDATHVFASGGYPKKSLLAIRADGAGDVTETHVKWSDGKAVAYVPSSVIVGTRLFSVDDAGIATCYDTADGRVVWRERLGGNFTSSPIAVGDRIYVSNEEGKTYVLAAGDEFKVLAENTLPGSQLATPAFSGSQVFIRTDTALICIGQPAANASR